MNKAGAGRLVLGALALAGCGAKAAGGDGGAGEGGAFPALLSLDVTASLKTPMPPAPTLALPDTSTFSLTLDAANKVIVAGGSARPVTTDARTFFSASSFDVARASPGCMGLDSIRYDRLDFTVTGTSLAGHATGAAIFLGPVGGSVGFTADLTGGPDTTAPFLVLRSSVTPFDPFVNLTMATSEPLPQGARARLVGVDGSSFDMIPSVTDGVIPVVSGFDLPDVVLPPGTAYSVVADGLVDFAGNSGAPDAPLRLGAVADAPLAPEDGFESVTSSTFGGAGVVRLSDLAPISGDQSLYVGGVGTPGHDIYMQGPELLVRLAMQPGDTKLRFTFRTVSAAFDARVFDGTVRVGSPGGKRSDRYVTFQAPPSSATVKFDDGTTVAIGGDQMLEVSLPPDAHDVVVVAIAARDQGCGAPSPAVGMIVDDMRLE